MSEPTTEVGRRLARGEPLEPPYNRASFHWETCGIWGNRGCTCGLADDIAAIEAEARADLTRRILAAIENLRRYPEDEFEDGYNEGIRDALAAIREEAK